MGAEDVEGPALVGSPCPVATKVMKCQFAHCAGCRKLSRFLFPCKPTQQRYRLPFFLAGPRHLCPWEASGRKNELVLVHGTVAEVYYYYVT